MKKFFFTFVITVCVFCAYAAVEEVNGVRWWYQPYADGVEIGTGNTDDIAVGLPSDFDGNLVVPESLGGRPVVAIGEYACYNCESIRSVSLPESVKSIKTHAFNLCYGLRNVDLHSVTNIDWSAFDGCAYLESIKLSDEIVHVGKQAFYNCGAGEYTEDGLTLYDGKVLVGSKSWMAQDVYVTNSIKVIADSAFEGKKILSTIKLNDGLVTIGDSSFSRSGLTEITTPDSVQYILGSAFSECSALTSVVINVGVSIIGCGAFKNCDNLVAMGMPEGVNLLGDDTFLGCTSLTQLIISCSVTNIPSGFAYGCTSLESITIPANVRSIGCAAFYCCKSLRAINLPDGVELMDGACFEGCDSLQSIRIPTSCTTLGGNCFSGCKSLSEMTIPANVRCIGYNAFSGCENVSVYRFEGSVPQSTLFLRDIPVTTTIYYNAEYASEWEKAFKTYNLTNIKQYTPGIGAEDDESSDIEKDSNPEEDQDFDGSQKHTYNGIVYENDVMCGLVQIVTAKETKTGVRVTGYILLDDGKKYSLRSSTVKPANGSLTGSSIVGKLGTLSFKIVATRISGTIGSRVINSADLDDKTGILKGTLTFSYIDAASGRLKTKRITLTGAASDGESIGDLSVKGDGIKRFSATFED